MSSCPHCAKNTIGRFAKFWSNSAGPVRCKHCNGLSYLHRRETTGLNAIVFPGSIVAFGFVVATNAWWPFYILGLVWLIAFWRVLWRAPLTPISEAQAASNRRYGNIIVGVVFGATIIWWLYHYVIGDL